MSKLFRRFVRETEGQDLVEYAMLVALIAIVCVAGVGAMGLGVSGFYNQIVALVPLP